MGHIQRGVVELLRHGFGDIRISVERAKHDRSALTVVTSLTITDEELKQLRKREP